MIINKLIGAFSSLVCILIYLLFTYGDYELLELHDCLDTFLYQVTWEERCIKSPNYIGNKWRVSKHYFDLLLARSY